MAATPRIFLSHAHADRDLAEHLSDLLCNGLPDLRLTDIFCSSLDGQSVPPGAALLNDIHAALASASLALFLVTPAFVASRYCAAEAGAAWGLGKPVVPLVVAPCTQDHIPVTLQPLLGGRLDSLPELSALRDRLAQTLGLGKSADGVWDRKRRDFLLHLETGRLRLARTNRRFSIPPELTPADRVRLSVSALVRIRIDGRSLLVRGSRIPDQYQPVGGVLRYFDSSIERLTALGMQFDDLLPVDEDSRHDLRRYFPADRVDAVVDWLDTRQGRELSPWREFHEELIQPGVLRAADFPHAQLEFLRTSYTGIRWSAHVNGWELLIADLFRLEPTRDQIDRLHDLRNAGDDRVIWAEDVDIDRGRLPEQPGDARPLRIAEPCRWFLH